MSERFRIRREPLAEEVVGPSFRCAAAARWLPRVLGAAVLAAGLIAAYQLPPTRLVKASYARQCIMAIGLLAAFWVVRTGREVDVAVTVGERALEFSWGGRRRQVSFDALSSMVFRAPFASGRRWVPAMVLEDEHGESWRVPAFLEGGASFVTELLSRAQRNDLDAWAQARKLEDRMGRARQWVVGGYLASLAIVVTAALLFMVWP